MNYTIPFRSTTKEHWVTNNLMVQWLDGQILKFTLTSSDDDTVDAYINLNLQMIRGMGEAGRDHLTLHDISHRSITMTSYFRKRLDEIADSISRGTTQHRSAVVLADGVSGRLFSIFGNIFTRTAQNTEQKYFNNEQDAIRWLCNYL